MIKKSKFACVKKNQICNSGHRKKNKEMTSKMRDDKEGRNYGR